MFLGWKNQYCENDYTTQSNLQVQYNPYQKNPMTFFIELEPQILQFVWKHKKTSNSQSTLEKEKLSWRNKVPWFKILSWSKILLHKMLWENLNEFFGQLTTELQYSRCMALAQRQKHKSMEQAREPRDELTDSHQIYNKGGKNVQWRKDGLFSFQWRKDSLFKKTASSQLLGKLDSYM